MSTISSVGSASQSLLLQQYQQQSQVGNPTNSTFGAARDAAFDNAAQSLGLDANQTSSLQGQIKDAVSTALQNADSSADKRSTIQNAVDGVLKKNGIDPVKFQAAIKSQFAKGATGARRHHHHGVGGASSQKPETSPLNNTSLTATTTQSVTSDRIDTLA